MVDKVNTEISHIAAGPSEDSPRSLSFERRVIAIESILASNVQFSELKLDRVMENGTDVYVVSDSPLDVSLRGGLLLDLEDELCRDVDLDIRVWFKVTADKSKLRSLRGVTPVTWDSE